MKNEMRKILLAVPISTLNWGELNAGGVDSVCQLLVKELVKENSENYKYRILAFDPFSKVKYTGEIINLTNDIEIILLPVNEVFYKVKIPGLIGCNLRVAQQVKIYKPDIFHTHQQTWIFGALKARKKIVTLHSYKKIARKSVSMMNDFLHEKIIPYVLDNFIDAYTVVGGILQNELIKSTEKKIHYISNPIDQVDLENQRRTNSKQISMISCCLITRRKKLELSIYLLHSLLKIGADVSLTIVGPIVDRDYYNELLEIIRSNGLSEKIKFEGGKSRNEVISYFKKSDLGVFLSQEETFGMVPLEMMAAGLPLLTTSVGVIKDRENEFNSLESVKIYKNEKMENLAIEVLSLVQKDTEDGKKYIKENYSALEVLKKYEAVYNEVMV